MPVFGPPTWAVLVFFRFRYPEIHAVVLIVGGALAAVGGRWLLALTFRRFGEHLPRSRQESLGALGKLIGESRGGLVASFGLFAVGRSVGSDVRGGRAGANTARPFAGSILRWQTSELLVLRRNRRRSPQPAQPAVQPRTLLRPGDRDSTRQRRPDRGSSLDRLASGDRHCPTLVGGSKGPPSPAIDSTRIQSPTVDPRMPGDGARRLLALHQAVFERVAHQFSTRCKSKFGQDVGAMGFDRADADNQLGGDLGVRVPHGQ